MFNVMYGSSDIRFIGFIHKIFLPLALVLAFIIFGFILLFKHKNESLKLKSRATKNEDAF